MGGETGMSVAKVYSCNVCGTPRKQANHWCLGFHRADGGSVVQIWTDKVAARRGALHFCGAPHAAQWAGQRLSTVLEEARCQPDLT